MGVTRVCWTRQARLDALVRDVDEVRPGAAGADAAEELTRRAVASVEGRLHLEQERHTQQLERLQMENEELRRATKAKSEKIATLRAQLEGR